MNERATRLNILSFNTPQMRAFHMAWIAFFLCFFAWFAIAPLSAIIAKDLHLSKAQMANTVIASVAITILARLLIGWICDRFGPRRTYAGLLVLGAIPVATAGLAQDYTTFFLARLAIGAIGASFVVTQFHTTRMFATNCVGTTNAMAAGWGNMGAGATNILMPLIVAGIVGLGISEHMAWRLSLLIPAALMAVCGVAYWFLTQDTPAGDLTALPKCDAAGAADSAKGKFWLTCKDGRVWALALIYGACFGIEIIVHNIASTYFQDHFQLDMKVAGLIAGVFGGLAIFARALGGIASDRLNCRYGLAGRRSLLGLVLFAQGLAMLFFSQMTVLPLAVLGLLVFGLFVHMAAGATYAVIPFVNRKALGSVAGIVGAGGNVGAVAAGFMLKAPYLSDSQALFYLGLIVVGISALAMVVRFSPADEQFSREELAKAAAAPIPPAAMPIISAGE